MKSGQAVRTSWASAEMSIQRKLNQTDEQDISFVVYSGMLNVSRGTTLAFGQNERRYVDTLDTRLFKYEPKPEVQAGSCVGRRNLVLGYQS